MYWDDNYDIKLNSENISDNSMTEDLYKTSHHLYS